MIEAFVSICLALVLGLLVYLVILVRDQRRPGYRLPTMRVRIKAPPELERRLTLLVGNKGTAYRLVRSVKRANPKRSDRWCWEKAIYDLERDRRA